MVTQSDVQAWTDGLNRFSARIARRLGRAEPTARPSAQASGAFSLNPG
jgi:hypothetical protein